MEKIANKKLIQNYDAVTTYIVSHLAAKEKVQDVENFISFFKIINV